MYLRVGLKPSRCAGLRLKMWLKPSFLFLSDLVFLKKSSQIVVSNSCPIYWLNSIVCATSNTSDNLVGLDNACSSQAFAGATSFCDPSEFPFSWLSTVEPSLGVNTVIGEELDPNHDSNLKFCETICFAEPTAYVSVISEEDGCEIDSLVTTPPLATESGTVVIDPSLSSSQVQDVKELLIEFQDILTSVPGCTNTLCHEIRLTTDAVIQVKPCPLPFAAREFVTQEVNDLLSLGVIEPSDNPYCFPIVVMKKKDGSMRLCIDFRKLNAITVFDAENIPRQDDLFNQLSHATIFSSCDLCKAYWQVPRCDQSLAEIKRLFSSPPILIIPDTQETFVVRSDASDFGIGAELLQDRDGILMPCRYASRKLLSRESRYSAIEREALELVFAVTQFQ
ncbi:LOW QUALITY PROTEIN: transposon ty3-g Gag-Pol polyprotein [Plakobranchus ocellatus]|uniref:Transposon ty3-g Gag-Pol polyprotein n=1 Tax=Plakobranchus ocellatus TaxID=259542 RepID=A0AAV4D7K5_9GAST|nr:LOW QUALITY PROTEIN: transposon ty3-g Gag-Pol polyprotein [Plakobranchus ocellatus]